LVFFKYNTLKYKDENEENTKAIVKNKDDDLKNYPDLTIISQSIMSILEKIRLLRTNQPDVFDIWKLQLEILEQAKIDQYLPILPIKK